MGGGRRRWEEVFSEMRGEAILNIRSQKKRKKESCIRNTKFALKVTYSDMKEQFDRLTSCERITSQPRTSSLSPKAPKLKEN